MSDTTNTAKQQQWYDAVPDEAFEEDESPVVVTSQSLRCGGSTHPTHVVLFTCPAYVPWNALLAEAQRQGWTYDSDQRVWLCPVCSVKR